MKCLCFPGLALLVIFTACSHPARHYELGGNPIITHMYSADPSARVFGDSLLHQAQRGYDFI